MTVKSALCHAAVMTDHPFLVAGGGIAGLAAALALSRIGREVHVFEQKSLFEEVGAGLQMSPNGVRALRWLGAWEAVEPSCVIPTEIHIRDGRSGVLLQRIRLGKPFEDRFGAPYRVCHRADLLGGLLAAARVRPRVALSLGQRAVAAVSTAQGASLEFENGLPRYGAGVIAADGIHSTLRRSLFGPGAPVYRGHALFRTLIPFNSVPPPIEADCVTLWLYPGGHVVHYAVSNWRSFNIVAAIDRPGSQDGWGQVVDGDDLRSHFSEADESLAVLLAAPQNWLTWQGADLPTQPDWIRDNIALIGDAAHATLPYLAQGAVMSLEDACVLASHLGQTAAVADGLAAYAATRRPRTARIQSDSRHLGGIYHARGASAMARNLALRAMGPEMALKRNAWIYAWQPPSGE